jgi:hypothetical protein
MRCARYVCKNCALLLSFVLLHRNAIVPHYVTDCVMMLLFDPVAQGRQKKHTILPSQTHKA